MRGRHTAELTHALARLVRASLASRQRRLQQLERQLTTFDAGRRLAAIKTRLVSVDGRMRSAATRRHDRAQAQLQHAAGRLETLSPIAVLGRGYAVAWNEDKTRVLRDASAVAPGDTVHVRLERGELECGVRSTAASTQRTQRTQRDDG
jgi:exodeoxyribonuclease VII large subunit